MDGTNIVVAVKLFGIQNKDSLQDIRLAIDNDKEIVWKHTFVDKTKAFSSERITFGNLIKDKTYTVIGQVMIDSVWIDLDEAKITAASFNAGPRNLRRNNMVRTLSNEEQPRRLNRVQPLSPILVHPDEEIALFSSGPGGGGPDPPPDPPLPPDVTPEYIIPIRPTQQTQNVYDKYGYYEDEANCCVANAVASAKEVQEKRQDKPYLNYSIGWFFGKTGISDTEGTLYKTAFNYLKSYGIPPYEFVSRIDNKSFYPDAETFNNGKTVANNSGNVSKYALPQTIKNYEEIYARYTVMDGNTDTYIEKICNAIKNTNHGNSDSTVVILTIDIDSSFDEAVWNDGIVGDLQNEFRGGHALLCIGWTSINNKKYWICQNSWTVGYQGMHMSESYALGDNGLVYIPFNWFMIEGSHSYGLGYFYILNDNPSAPDFPPGSSLDVMEISHNSIKIRLKELDTSWDQGTRYLHWYASKDSYSTDSTNYKGMSTITGAPVNSDPYIITPLDQNTMYYITCEIKYGTSEGAILLATKKITVKTTIPPYSPWQWSFPIISNSLFNLSMQEWTEFKTFINTVRATKGLTPYNFSALNNNTDFYASYFNEAIAAITSINGHGTLPAKVYPNDEIYGLVHFGAIRDAINTCI